MDLDFLLFNPPKRSYSFVDFWGEAIFVPKTRKRAKPEGSLASLLNCYQPSSAHEAHLTVEAVLDGKGLDAHSELTAESSLGEDE
jgi:hypothetical protein